MPRWPERSVEERFWSKVDKNGDDQCWLWTKSLTSAGYGQFVISSQERTLAHVYAYRLLVGEIPLGLLLDHIRCPRHCVRPDHLRLVTTKQNGENRVAPPRATTGVRGVCLVRKTGRYRTRVMHNGKEYSVGSFITIEEAEQAVKELRCQLFTHNTADRT